MNTPSARLPFFFSHLRRRFAVDLESDLRFSVNEKEEKEYKARVPPLREERREGKKRELEKKKWLKKKVQ